MENWSTVQYRVRGRKQSGKKESGKKESIESKKKLSKYIHTNEDRLIRDKRE